MPTESIFHKLVKNENSYTQLLCNILKRDQNFRNDFFGLKGINLTVSIEPAHIHSQKHLGEHGQADILVDSPSLLLIIEVKTESGCRMTNRQPTTAANPKGYVAYLKNEAEGRAEVWLVYLVPAEWKLLVANRLEIEEFNANCDQNGVKVTTILWEDVTALSTRGNEHKNYVSVVQDFHLILAERFGPTSLTSEEAQTVCKPDFPLEAGLKLIRIIEELRSRMSFAKELDIEKGAIGFYLSSNNCSLYVGCWLDFWDGESGRHPLCFGIKDPSKIIGIAFTESLLKVYDEAPIPCNDWLMGYVPERDFVRADAVIHISGNLQRIFDSISDATT